MNLPERDLPFVYLKPGEMHFTRKPTLIVTVLGSCLSVTMFNRRTGLGAICHGLLPQCKGGNLCNGGCRERYKYVDCSIRKMLKLFEKNKVHRREIEVKCFGGADMISRESKKAGGAVGLQNVKAAERILTAENLKLAASDVGGLRGRKLFFYTDIGDVFLKRLSHMNNQGTA